MASQPSRRLKIETPDGVKLRGLLTCPRRSRALVVLMHGINVNLHEYDHFYDDVAQRLVDQEMAVLQFDFRGHGRSHGKQVDFSIAAQLIDAPSAIEHASAILDLDALPLHLVGTSFGGPPALWAANHYRNRCASVFLLSPVLD